MRRFAVSRVVLQKIFWPQLVEEQEALVPQYLVGYETFCNTPGATDADERREQQADQHPVAERIELAPSGNKGQRD